MSGSSIRWEFDTSELDRLVVNLEEAPTRAQLASRKATKRSAEIVDKAMTMDAKGHRYLPRFPRNVGHTTHDFDAQIGFKYSRGLQGPLAWIILHGSINNAPVWDYTAGLRRSVPEILQLYGHEAEGAVLGPKAGA